MSAALFPALIVAHVAAAVVLVVAALARAVRTRRLSAGTRDADGALRALARLASYTDVGGAALLLSGIGMVALAPGVFLSATWLRVALALFAVNFLVGVVLARRVERQLRAIAAITAAGCRSLAWQQLAGRLYRLSATSFAILLAIVVLLMTRRPA
jgi:hypothetical protein